MKELESSSVIRFLLLQQRWYYHELLVHKAVIENMKLLLPTLDTESLAKLYRDSEAFQAKTDQFFAQSDTLIDTAAEADLDQLFAAWIEKQKSQT